MACVLALVKPFHSPREHGHGSAGTVLLWIISPAPAGTGAGNAALLWAAARRQPARSRDPEPHAQPSISSWDPPCAQAGELCRTLPLALGKEG